MNKTASRQLGFAYGMIKSASGDNQPGPMPQQPAPPDSHKARNVALGAGVLAAGLFGGRHLYKTQNALATKLLKNQRYNQGRDLISRSRKGENVTGELKNFIADRNKVANPTAGEKFKVLGGHYKQRISDAFKPSRDLKNQRFKAKHKIKPEPVDAVDNSSAQSNESLKDKIKRITGKAQTMALTGAAIGGGAIAGASGASKAREPQSDDNPGT